MNNLIIGVEVSVPGIEVAIVDTQKKEVIPGTKRFRAVHTNESAENLIQAWSETITEVHALREKPVSDIAIAMPGPFDFKNGISYMINQRKFDALYNVNVKALLAAKLGIDPDYIKFFSNICCFITGELAGGAAQGYQNILAFTLNQGLGSASYHSGVLRDAGLWNKPFRNGIVEDYIGTSWLTRRYEEFTGIRVHDVKELAHYAATDDGIGQLVFNEYGENFVKFLLQYVGNYDPDLLLIGGHSNAWEFFLDHVIDRLHEKNIKIPVKLGTLRDESMLLGASILFNDEQG